MTATNHPTSMNIELAYAYLTFARILYKNKKILSSNLFLITAGFRALRIIPLALIFQWLSLSSMTKKDWQHILSNIDGDSRKTAFHPER